MSQQSKMSWWIVLHHRHYRHHDDKHRPAFIPATPLNLKRPQSSTVSLQRPHNHQHCQRRRHGRTTLSMKPPEEDELIFDLRDDGSPKQILALIKLTKLPSSEKALNILQKSEVMKSQFRKTRIAVLDTLGKLRQPSSLPMLTSTLQNDTDHSIRAAAAGGLGEILVPEEHKENSCSILREAALHDDHFIVRYSAIVTLGNIGDIRSIPVLIPLISNLNTPALECSAAIDAVGEILSIDLVTDSFLQTVLIRVNDDEDLIRAAVVRTLVRWKRIKGVSEVLSSILKTEVEQGRSSFVHALLQQLLLRDDDV